MGSVATERSAETATTPLHPPSSGGCSTPRRCPVVRFSETVVVIRADEDEHEDEHEYDFVSTSVQWYHILEIEAFRNEARRLSRRLQIAVAGSGASAQPLLARDAATRGLEPRGCPERQRRRLLATHLVLQASRTLPADRLAELAARCNGWAAALAREEARRDFARAYGPPSDDEDADAMVLVGSPTTGSDVSRKRRLVATCSERCVRQRFVAVE